MLAPLAEGLMGDFLKFCVESRDMYKSFVEEIEKETGDNVGFGNVELYIQPLMKKKKNC